MMDQISEAHFAWISERKGDILTYRLKASKNKSRFIWSCRAGILLFLVMTVFTIGAFGFLLLTSIPGLGSGNLPTFIQVLLVSCSVPLVTILLIVWNVRNNLIIIEVQLDAREHTLSLRGLRLLSSLETLIIPYADIERFQHGSNTYRNIAQHHIYVVFEGKQETLFNSLSDEEYASVSNQLRNIDPNMFKDL